MSIQWNDRRSFAAPRSRDRLRERLTEAELSVEREANGRHAANAQLAVLLEQLADAKVALRRAERRAEISARVLGAADNLVDARRHADMKAEFCACSVHLP